MGKYCKFLCILVTCLSMISILTACSDNEPESYKKGDRLILIYAVAANNLQPNLRYDMQEMLYAAPALDLNKNTVLVYSVVNSGECLLQQLRNNKGNNPEFVTVKKFDELPLSTSEERISEVIEYVAANYRYSKKGLVLWSHADGWLPWFQGSTPSGVKKKSFGWDNYENATYKTNINSLSEAIPEGVFDFIWFDCCYMANIETVYQLRAKAEHIVGSVLEIANDGMPYDLTLPYLLKNEPDLNGAAFQLFRYYDSSYVPVSVSVMNTGNLDLLADATSRILRQGNPPASFSSIQTYQRSPITVKFYDMGQLLESYSGVSVELKEDLEEAFEKVVEYKLISEYDFNGKAINVKDYSGLSMHHYTDDGSGNDEFYRLLDWYQATR